MSGSFRTVIWDPGMIICQIICLQSAFYSAETVLLSMWGFATYYPSLEHIFALRAQLPLVIIQLTSIIFCAFLFPYIVVRARLCLDFSVTLHFIHFLLVLLFNRALPSQFTWWLLQVISASLCTILTEWLCFRKECAEIPLTQAPSSISRTIDT